mmetsp:Transcript_99406/g.176297  ORF Transcript_99406/g.176297 Transcript_99406/m.176297 type:complete len:621 (+) Transcript_99406:143-2005(+)
MGQGCSCFSGMQAATTPLPTSTEPVKSVPTNGSAPDTAPTNGSSPEAAVAGSPPEPVKTNGSLPEAQADDKKSAAPDSSAAEAVQATAEAAPAPSAEQASSGGMVLTRAPRTAPQPLETGSESSSDDDDYSPTGGTWIAPVAELGPDGLPSMGSAGHAEGECKRCCFFPKGRCTNGYECRFCHFDHEKRKRLKKKKKKASENPTPTSVAGSLSASVITPGGSLLAGTPSAHMSNMLGMQVSQLSTPMAASMAGTPLGRSFPMTPVSPSAPPMLPPTLTGIETAEPPPPPAVEALVEATEAVERQESVGTALTRPAETETSTATATASGPLAAPSNSTTPAAMAAAELAPAETAAAGEASESGPGTEPAAAAGMQVAASSLTAAVTASAADVSGKPVTLTDLLSTTASSSMPAAQVPTGLAAVATHPAAAPVLSTDVAPFWPSAYASTALPGVLPSTDMGVGSLSDQWAAYAYNEWMAAHYPYYGAEMAPVDPAVAAAPLFPSAAPDELGALGTSSATSAPTPVPRLPAGGSEKAPKVSTSGMENDSPRSVLLTLCGAWGALKTTKDGEGPVLSLDSAKKGTAPESSKDEPQLSRLELLRFRRALPKTMRPPRELKSLRCR